MTKLLPMRLYSGINTEETVNRNERIFNNLKTE